MGGYNTTVLMVADPGNFTGSAEAKYYIQNLEVSLKYVFNPGEVPSLQPQRVSRLLASELMHGCIQSLSRTQKATRVIDLLM